MRGFGFVLFCFVLAAASPSSAQEKIAIGPAADWVSPLPIPDEQSEATKSQPVVLRLIDIQERIDADGAHVYRHMAARVDRSEALSAVGATAIVWQPAIQDATVHALRIRRGDRTIDVLAKQDFNVLRREDGLERGLLDGRLTAVLQVAGLRVGDTLEIAYTTDTSNPVLKGRNELAFATGGGTPVDRFSMRVSWPSDRAVHYHSGEALPDAARSDADGLTTLSIDERGFTAPETPVAAPARFFRRNEMVATDLDGWADASRLFAPVYADAAAIAPDSPLHEEIDRIAALGPDSGVRAAAALKLVQTKVRYLADASGLGGYKPQDADTVWKNRYGDCKGKTALLLALLKGLGIAAEPALVSTEAGDGLNDALPMIGRFNHVIVRARIAGETYWLDGTRLGDTSLDRLDVPDFRWALPVDPDGAALVKLTPTPPAEPESELAMTFDARKGLAVPATAKIIYTLRGDRARATGTRMDLLPEDKRHDTAEKTITNLLNFVTPETVDFRFDKQRGEAVFTASGTADMDWDLDGDDARRRYTLDYARSGVSLAPDRPDGDVESLPVSVSARYGVIREKVLLPHGGKGFYVEGDPIDETVGGIHYTRTAILDGDTFTMRKVTRGKAHELTMAEAETADDATDTLSDKGLYIRVPYRYARNRVKRDAIISADTGDDDTADSAAEADDPVQAALAKAGAQMRDEDMEAALATLDAAIGEAPDAATLRVMRATIHSRRGESADAATDIDAVLASDPHNRPALRLRLNRLTEIGRYQDASIVADRLILLDPEQSDHYLRRAAIRRAMGNDKGALADLALVERIEPDNDAARVRRVAILTADQRYEDALDEADAYITRFPNNPAAHSLRADVLGVMDRTDAARDAARESLAIEDNADARAIRLRYGLDATPAAALRDMLRIVALQPRRQPTVAAYKYLLKADGAADRLEAAYAKALEDAPDERMGILQARAQFYGAADKPELALADLDTLVKENPNDPTFRNNRCWYRATHDIALGAALKDCDAAIAMADSPGFRDSRALVHYRMGAYEAAIAEYDRVLRKSPNLSGSLFGRGLAELAAGEEKAGKADIAKARARSPSIDERYAAWGLTAPQTAAN